jgi:putative ribosome biogenesis GTPase RsgA
MQHVYQEIGYKCLRVSSTEMKGVEQLKEMMIGKVSMFSGHSGVGNQLWLTLWNLRYILKQSNFRGQ